jgi:hypothetical protein
MNVCSKMFSDARFEQFGKYRYFRELDGRKTGVVVAIMDSRHDTYVVYGIDLRRLVDAVDNGVVDDAKVVAARIRTGSKGKIYGGEIDAIELLHLLKDEEPRQGKYGDFYVIPPGLAFPDHRLKKDADEPF